MGLLIDRHPGRDIGVFDAVWDGCRRLALGEDCGVTRKNGYGSIQCCGMIHLSCYDHRENCRLTIVERRKTDEGSSAKFLETVKRDNDIPWKIIADFAYLSVIR